MSKDILVNLLEIGIKDKLSYLETRCNSEVTDLATLDSHMKSITTCVTDCKSFATTMIEKIREKEEAEAKKKRDKEEVEAKKKKEKEEAQAKKKADKEKASSKPLRANKTEGNLRVNNALEANGGKNDKRKLTPHDTPRKGDQGKVSKTQPKSANIRSSKSTPNLKNTIKDKNKDKDKEKPKEKDKPVNGKDKDKGKDKPKPKPNGVKPSKEKPNEAKTISAGEKKPEEKVEEKKGDEAINDNKAVIEDKTTATVTVDSKPIESKEEKLIEEKPIETQTTTTTEAKTEEKPKPIEIQPVEEKPNPAETQAAEEKASETKATEENQAETKVTPVNDKTDAKPKEDKHKDTKAKDAKGKDIKPKEDKAKPKEDHKPKEVKPKDDKAKPKEDKVKDDKAKPKEDKAKPKEDKAKPKEDKAKPKDDKKPTEDKAKPKEDKTKAKEDKAKPKEDKDKDKAKPKETTTSKDKKAQEPQKKEEPSKEQLLKDEIAKVTLTNTSESTISKHEEPQPQEPKQAEIQKEDVTHHNTQVTTQTQSPLQNNEDKLITATAPTTNAPSNLNIIASKTFIANWSVFSTFLTKDEKLTLALQTKALFACYCKDYLNTITTEVTHYQTKLETINKKYSAADFAKEQPKFELAKGAIKAVTLLNQDIYFSRFTQPEIPNSSIILIYKIFFQVINMNTEILKISDEATQWKMICEFFTSKANGKLGSLINELLLSIDFSYPNLYKINKLCENDLEKLTPVYYSKQCSTTGLFIFIVKEALEYGGILQDKKTSASRIKNNLVNWIEILKLRIEKINASIGAGK